MSNTIVSIFNKTGMHDTQMSGDVSRSNGLKDFSKIVADGQNRTRSSVPKGGYSSVSSSTQGKNIPSIKESTDHIKKILMECNFMRTRSKKLECGMINVPSRFASSALDYQKNQESKAF